jgi:hypothetical protein
MCTWWLQHTSFILLHCLAQSDCLTADRQGQGDTRLTLTPSVIPNSNYVITVSDWNCLKYFCVFLHCKSSGAQRLFDHPVTICFRVFLPVVPINTGHPVSPNNINHLVFMLLTSFSVRSELSLHASVVRMSVLGVLIMQKCVTCCMCLVRAQQEKWTYRCKYGADRQNAFKFNSAFARSLNQSNSILSTLSICKSWPFVWPWTVRRNHRFVYVTHAISSNLHIYSAFFWGDAGVRVPLNILWI